MRLRDLVVLALVTGFSATKQDQHIVPRYESTAPSAVLAPMVPGDAVRNYQLVERTAILGVCGHDRDYPEAGVVVRQDYVEVAMQQKQLTGGESLRLEGPSLEYQCVMDNTDSIFVNENYRLRKKFAGGSHGEVWRAVRIQPDGLGEEPFILKRVFAELGDDILQSGLREAHFGALLRDEPHVARFVEHFYRDAPVVGNVSSPGVGLQELWLVFYEEGISLRHYMYATTRSESSVVFQPSHFWHRMRVEDSGGEVLKEVMRQLLQGVAAVHARGIVHRDIKVPRHPVPGPDTAPSNILVNNQDTPVLVKLADFGSAVDGYANDVLYGEKGPSQAEETREYQPPEVLLHGDIPYDPARPTSYDMWSVGVVFLELILGSPHVFAISSRARAKLDVHLQHKARALDSAYKASRSEEAKRKSYLLQVFTEFCIYEPPSLVRYHNEYALVHSDCNFGTFNQTLQARDPLGRGFQDAWGLNLLYKLLQWDPAKRISAADALQHAYFRGPYVCGETGRAFATRAELEVHEAYLESQRHSTSFILRKARDLPSTFHCNCKRSFATADACNLHLRARHHATDRAFCHYASDPIRHAMTPLSLPPTTLDAGAGAFHGRRQYMEDMVVVVPRAEMGGACDLYAVLDGHMGLGAVTYVREHLHDRLVHHLQMQWESPPASDGNTTAQVAEELAIRQALADLHNGFVATSDDGDFSGADEKTRWREVASSGTTLTLVLHYPDEHRLVCANVGDSRAVLYGRDLASDVISVDHLPDTAAERRRIESSGGFVAMEGVWRVMGQLAVSRTLGDRHLRQYVSFDPSITHVNLPVNPGFIVVASDGVWDTVTNDDAGRFVDERLDRDDLYEIAQDLVIEAYVRGSADNMLALVIDLRSDL
uniref:Secreted protein n=1 Tax=Achlya hypogyna TaxID=1202772 RepID=A0A0A7CPJ9_ACHHY|nr:secreted protein [Achlya hypogyna]